MSHQSRREADFYALISELAEDAAFPSAGGRHLVRIPNGQVFETGHPIAHEYLEKSFFRRHGRMPEPSAFRQFLRCLRARALSNSNFLPRSDIRLGVSTTGEILFDLANNRNEFVRIRSGEWDISNIGFDHVFLSVRGLSAIPNPAQPGDATLDLNPLRPLVNAVSDTAWSAILEWLTAAMRPDQPCPVLILHGPPQSGKTNAARLLRTLIDPNTHPIAALPSRGGTLEHDATDQHVIVFDHVTRMSASATDALCRVSSGATGPAHPIILTTPRMDIHDWQPRADLAARAITVHLPAIENPRPRPELEREFEALRPALLSALLTKIANNVGRDGSVRRIDNRALLIASATEDPVYKSIVQFMSTRDQWQGSATDLFNEKEICVTRSPRALSHTLRVLAATLHEAGIVINFHRIHHGDRQITMNKCTAGLQPAPELYSGSPTADKTCDTSTRPQPPLRNTCTAGLQPAPELYSGSPIAGENVHHPNQSPSPCGSNPPPLPQPNENLRHPDLPTTPPPAVR